MYVILTHVIEFANVPTFNICFKCVLKYLPANKNDNCAASILVGPPVPVEEKSYQVK